MLTPSESIQEWSVTSLWPWQRVAFIDGAQSKFGGLVMVRRAAGKKEYRQLTDDEAIEMMGFNAY